LGRRDELIKYPSGLERGKGRTVEDLDVRDRWDEGKILEEE